MVRGTHITPHARIGCIAHLRCLAASRCYTCLGDLQGVVLQLVLEQLG
jgi:hypothetical protein